MCVDKNIQADLSKNTSMEYVDTGVSQMAIGDPTDEEKEQLVKEGYTFMSWGKMKVEPYEYYEIWLK